MNELLFAERLKTLLSTGGNKYGYPISQAELSKKLGITRQAISSYLNGATLPTIDKLKAIAEYFNVSCDYLIGFSEAERAENRNIVDRLGFSEELITQIETINKRDETFRKIRKNKEVTEISMLNHFLRLCCDKRIFMHLCEYANAIYAATENPQLSLGEIIISNERSEAAKKINSLNCQAEEMGLELLDQRESIEYRELFIGSVIHSIITEMFAEEKNKAWSAYFNLIKEGDNNADD